MIRSVEVLRRAPFVGGASFGEIGPYERIDGIAYGTLDPAHPGNAGIALLDQAPRNAAGLVEYRAGFVLLRPVAPDRGNGRLLYEVNNRGRIMIFNNLCGGAVGNTPKTPEALGNAMPLRRGFAMLWSGWDATAAPSTGLSLEIPVIPGLSKPIREEFVSGTRLGVHETFKLSYKALDAASVTVRRTQTAECTPVPCVMDNDRAVRPLVPIEPGSIYEIRYTATDPPPLGVGFAATRDLIAYMRAHGDKLIGRPVTHALGFGISQAGRYLRDHIAQGFNRAEDGGRVFDGILTHVAGIGRVFLNAPFGQPFRTRTWHEDHDFPEIEFPFAAASLPDPVTGKTAALMPGLPSDPLLIETNTSTEYWQKGASLLHTDPLGTRDVEAPTNVRTYLIAGTQHGGKANMPRDNGPCRYPRNWHNPMPAVRALLVALDEWVTSGRLPPESRVPRIADGTLVPAEQIAMPGFTGPNQANPVTRLSDWANPVPSPPAWRPLVPAVDADGNEIAGIRLPDIAAPTGTFTGWNLYAAPYPEGELADREGAFLAFAATESERGGDPRSPMQTRYPDGSNQDAVRQAAEALVAQRLLLTEDAAAFGGWGGHEK